MILLVSSVVQIVLVLIAANFLLRTIVFTTLTFFGAFDPRWDRYWPRFPWRIFLFAWIAFKDWQEENFKRGTASAGFAGFLVQLALMKKPNDSLLGRVRLPFGIPHYALSGEPSQRHTLYVASARSGKSLELMTGLALMPINGRVFLIDVKGEITLLVGYKLEERGHELVVLDPLKCLPRPSQSINILAQIAFISAAKGQDMTTMVCNRLADVSFPPTPSDKAFFVDSGREGWARIMCFAWLTIFNANMLDVRRLVTVGYIEAAPDDPELAMNMLWEDMLQCKAYDGYVSKFASQMLSSDERTRENILATIRSKTAFWDHQQIQDISRENDINLCDLKNPDSNVILSLVAGVGDMQSTFKPWFAQISSLSLAIMEWLPGDLKVKTRFIFEEIQALGEKALPDAATAFPLLPGRGASVTAVVQDIPGLRSGFPKDWQSMIGNAQHVHFMACNDPETYEYVANKGFGRMTVKRKKWGIPFLWTVGRYEAPVITPDQVRRFLEAGRQNQIILRNGRRSMFAKIALSYKLLPVWMIDPSPDHGESRPRAWFRSIYNRHFTPKPQPQPQPQRQQVSRPSSSPNVLGDADKLEQLARIASHTRRNRGSRNDQPIRRKP